VSALAFLTPDAAPGTTVARTPMERPARAAGARFEVRDGWNVATGFASDEVERARVTEAVGFADRSAMRKLELHGEALSSLALKPAIAEPRAGAWWCPVTPSRVLVLGGAEVPELPDGVSVVDVTSGLCAMALVGPGCRELLARFCAIDVRPSVAPVTAFRPGSVARTPGYVLVEAEQRLLIAVGWALGQYIWEVVADAAEHLGGGPIGADVLAEAGDA
jgi:glycine cleavage system aminomethyltransferase T